MQATLRTHHGQRGPVYFIALVATPATLHCPVTTRTQLIRDGKWCYTWPEMRIAGLDQRRWGHHEGWSLEADLGPDWDL